MFIRKIPRRFLMHSVRLAEVETESGAFGGKKITEGELIERVRIIAPKREITVTHEDENFSVSAILLHQPGTSTDCTFEVGKYLRWNGQLYEIAGIEEQYEAERLHHTEVHLICR